ncbi:PX domain-containing protein kinase-like protein isoform X2 [Engraulis encrasicolus]|uniref:PX domain-containing protein kinase-like protein isoform X2 n=2 Tax=Engraulis encrasicolus TaxID=184585 RepID=UPI002FD2F026
MAFKEKESHGQVTHQLIDDTVGLKAVIEASLNLNSHTEYIIRVQRGVATEQCWQVVRRYSDFDMLNNSLMISGVSLPLPPKKLIGNMDREFIAERQKGLQSYLNFITQHHILSSSEVVKKFLDTNNYSINYTEMALQQVSMFFRSDPKWEVAEPLKDIGWRIRKRYFLVRNKEQPKEQQILSWVGFGPDKFLSDKDLLSTLKILPSLLCPFICPLTFATTNESSALIIRMFNDKGTLRDHICKVKPKEPFLKKYCRPKKIQGLELQQIKTYGRQILEALKFLHDKGFPYGHLHASNVLLEDDTCKLLDIENSLLGLPSYYKPYVTQFRKINMMEAVDVYSFGHLLFEMTYGRPPDAIPVDHLPPAPFTSVVSVLQSILSSEACKTGMPTVTQLLQGPLFKDVLLFNTVAEKAQFKITSKLKEALKTAKDGLEKKIQEEQKTLHQHRRLTKAQSHHGSEEEKKRRKILARKVQGPAPHLHVPPHRLPRPPQSMHHFEHVQQGAPPPVPPPPPSSALSPVCDSDPPLFSSPVTSGSDSGRTALLSSIQGFSKGKLKKAETNDRSDPLI